MSCDVNVFVFVFVLVVLVECLLYSKGSIIWFTLLVPFTLCTFFYVCFYVCYCSCRYFYNNYYCSWILSSASVGCVRSMWCSEYGDEVHVMPLPFVIYVIWWIAVCVETTGGEYCENNMLDDCAFYVLINALSWDEWALLPYRTLTFYFLLLLPFVFLVLLSSSLL